MNTLDLLPLHSRTASLALAIAMGFAVGCSSDTNQDLQAKIPPEPKMSEVMLGLPGLHNGLSAKLILPVNGDQLCLKPICDYPAPSPRLIFFNDSGEDVQTIALDALSANQIPSLKNVEIKGLVNLSSEVHARIINFGDFNFDGFADVFLTEDRGLKRVEPQSREMGEIGVRAILKSFNLQPLGGDWLYSAYLFDKKTGRFVKNDELSWLATESDGEIYFDIAKKTISTLTEEGCCRKRFSDFTYNKKGEVIQTGYVDEMLYGNERVRVETVRFKNGKPSGKVRTYALDEYLAQKKAARKAAQ